MGNAYPAYRQITLFSVLAVLGLVAQFYHVKIPHTEVLIEGRWAFGFMGFALLRPWWAACLLAAVLAIPWGTDIPFLIGWPGNLAYALPAMLVIRNVHPRLLRRFGPSWIYGVGWAAMVMFCYQAFTTPVVWGVTGWMNHEPIGPKVVQGWLAQPFLVEGALVSLFSAVAMVAVLTHEHLRENQDRLRHLNQVLLGIRSVNQLIVAENDPQDLIERACKDLTETMGYFYAWITRFDPDGRVIGMGHAGVDGGFGELRDGLERGIYPECMQRALEGDETVVLVDPSSQCADCPLGRGHAERAGLARRLRYGNTVYGVLVVSVPVGYADDQEEQVLFEEVAGDIGFALHKLEADQHLHNSRLMLARTERIAGVGSWEWEVQSDRVTWSEELFRIFGLEPRDEAPSFAEHQAMYLPEDRQRLVAAVEECVREGTPYEMEVRLRRPDGAIRHCYVQGVAERGNDGMIRRLMGSLQDITKRKEAEEALRESSGLLGKAEELSRSGAWKFDVQTKQSVISENWRRLVGLKNKHVSWEELSALLPSEERPRLQAALEKALAGLAPYDIEHDLVRRSDGVRITIHSLGEVVWDDAGNPKSISGVSQDITEYRRAEAALRESERRWRHILVETPQVGVSLDPHGKVVFANKHLLELTGYEAEEVLGQDWFDLFIPEEGREEARRAYQAVIELRDTQGISSYENEILTRTRERRLIAWSNVMSKNADGLITDVTSLGIDLTERQQAEHEREKLREQLNQSQKMESVGRLAGGVAHDFNNMLSVILGHAEMVLDDLPAESPLRVDIVEIRESAERSANLTRQLLAFARKQTVAPKTLDLNGTVSAMLKMLRRLVGEDVDLLWKPGTGVAPVRIDPGQVDQMLANLVVNARDAIGPKVGKVTIETANVNLDEEYCNTHAGFVAGDYVMLAVSDDGCGMDEETRAKVFEPFFTTKGMGEGTGLGLATVYGIVKQNNGFINVYSELGQGTTFRIYFNPEVVDRRAPELARADAAPATHGSETILLVEDEPAILMLGMKMLERQGYQVLAANTPGQAINLAEQHAGEIHLLITDVVMPEMNGRDLAKRLLSLYPKLKRLFMSGYTANVVAHHGVLDEGINFLQKPFSMKSLTDKVREALEG